MGTILYLAGLALAVYAVYEIFTKKTATEMPTKILWSVVILATSWIGLILYYAWLRNKLK